MATKRKSTQKAPADKPAATSKKGEAELNEDQLKRVTGGLLPAVGPEK